MKTFFALLCVAFLAAPVRAAEEVPARVLEIDARVQEVYAMDFKELSAKERGALRKELRGLKKEMKAIEKEHNTSYQASERLKDGPRGSGLYISTGALIIILILLIILL
ncbi:hypothetical protein [Nitritalea halalkaliphila]|nr:hypothetical protein [Nitritalea halalkaliphila]